MKHDKCALISGCMTTEESADAVFPPNRFNGALTYYLLDTLNAAAGLSLPLTTVVNNVTTALRANNYSQTPQLRGPSSLTQAPFLAQPQAAVAAAAHAKTAKASSPAAASPHPAS
jgi:hypothetical protein